MCKRTKVNFSHRYAPLHPVPVPDELGLCFAMDHTILTRKTEAGNTAVLVIVECFSGYPHLICVKDTTAETTARAIVHNVIPMWGLSFQPYTVLTQIEPSICMKLVVPSGQKISTMGYKIITYCKHVSIHIGLSFSTNWLGAYTSSHHRVYPPY